MPWSRTLSRIWSAFFCRRVSRDVGRLEPALLPLGALGAALALVQEQALAQEQERLKKQEQRNQQERQRQERAAAEQQKKLQEEQRRMYLGRNKEECKILREK